MEAAKRHLRDQRSMIALVSGPASPPNHTPRLKHLHLRNHPCSLILQPSPLLHIVLLRILPSLILKVQIPQILVDHILPLPQIIHPRLIRLHKRILLRPEHKHEHSKRQHHTCDHAHVSTPSPAESVPAAHRHPHQALPRSPAQGFPAAPSTSESEIPDPPSPAETPPSAQSTPRYRTHRESAQPAPLPRTSPQTSSESRCPTHPHPSARAVRQS